AGMSGPVGAGTGGPVGAGTGGPVGAGTGGPAGAGTSGRAGAAVQVRDLTVALDGAQILRGVDVDVAAGEWVIVIGPNGAGKSTLLRAVVGLVPVTGQVRLFGRDAGRMRRRERARLVATVPQQPVVPPGMTVFDYTLLGRTPHLRPLVRESAADLAVANRVLQLLALDMLDDLEL